ncbi:MAG TPA: hypothetical protein VH019_08290 [Rhizomicrobium sp.]|nr:hypothetical protein [Rhizomicrobium sp.]
MLLGHSGHDRDFLSVLHPAIRTRIRRRQALIHARILGADARSDGLRLRAQFLGLFNLAVEKNSVLQHSLRDFAVSICHMQVSQALSVHPTLPQGSRVFIGISRHETEARGYNAANGGFGIDAIFAAKRAFQGEWIGQRFHLGARFNSDIFKGKRVMAMIARYAPPCGC